MHSARDSRNQRLESPQQERVRIVCMPLKDMLCLAFCVPTAYRQMVFLKSHLDFLVINVSVMYPQLWRKFMTSAGSDDNGLLTASILVASLELQKDDPNFKETYMYVKLCHGLFGVRDVNKDGYLSEDEYKRAFAGIGINDTSFVHTGFEYLDVNKDGKLNINEYTAGWLAYLTTEDEHLLFGPLVS